MILDATAGNRTMWKINDNPNILFIDIEPELEIKPDKIMDCSNTAFNDQYFNTIFFDPPHEWGRKKHSNIFTIPNRKHPSYKKYKLGGGDTYYGWEKYSSKVELLSFIHKSQEEFYRILTNEGVLFLKWNEFKIPLSKILPFFKNWVEIMRIPVCSPRQKVSKHRTFWCLFMKGSQFKEK